MDILKTLGEIGIIPVIKLENPGDASRLAESLLQGGLPCAEITFRAAGAEEAIHTIVTTHPEILVGAGTVITLEQAQKAVDAGAQFMVSPGFNPSVVDWCISRNIPVIPGVATPSEAMMGLVRGLTVMKFFPAESLGGREYLNAISPALPGARFVPTGGVGPENLIAWIKIPCVHAVAGSWLVAPRLLREGLFDEVAMLAAEAVKQVKSARSGEETK